MNNVIPSVSKTLDLLDLVAKSEQGLNQVQLSKTLQISMSTTYRILQTLMQHQWLRKDGSGAYVLSLGLIPIATKSLNSVDFIEQARSVVEAIPQKYGLSCKLSVRRGDQQIVAIRAEPEGPIQTTGKVGSRYPITEGSSGAALLSHLSEADLLALSEKLNVTEVDREALLSAVQNISQKGYAIKRKIHNWPIDVISVPIKRRKGDAIAALTFFYVSDSQNETELVEKLFVEEQSISALLVD